MKRRHTLSEHVMLLAFVLLLVAIAYSCHQKRPVIKAVPKATVAADTTEMLESWRSHSATDLR